MHIIITLAGHSRRFKAAGYTKPKFLLDVGGAMMIEHVVSMFDDTDTFYFILTHEQLAQFPEIKTVLHALRKNVHLVLIEPHEKGPVWSCLQLVDIPADEPVIVSYCDFFVEWNYTRFKQEVYGYDGAIPAFKGFHPASFGHTYYAYMRVTDNGKKEFLELREKNSFTDTRENEYASAGIYYFANFEVFEKYAKQLMINGFENLKEGYVSLLFNPMQSDGLKIKVTEVDKFICLGTPEDLGQYLFWHQYFSSLPYEIEHFLLPNRQVNIIPMAGRGSRFKEFGYRVGKPLIRVRNRPMVIAACESFPQADKWVFLSRQGDLKLYPFEKELSKLDSESKVISVEGTTSGQLATCLLAREELKSDDSIFIASCDYETRFNHTAWKTLTQDDSVDVVIWTYRMKEMLMKDPKAFAYCVVSENDNQVKQIVEKDTISENPGQDPVIIGSFWFRRASDFLNMADQAIENDVTVNGEHYVGNSINLLINEGKRVVVFEVDQWISLGDPFELNVYYYWEDFFNKHKVGSVIEHAFEGV